MVKIRTRLPKGKKVDKKTRKKRIRLVVILVLDILFRVTRCWRRLKVIRQGALNVNRFMVLSVITICYPIGNSSSYVIHIVGEAVNHWIALQPL